MKHIFGLSGVPQLTGAQFPSFFGLSSHCVSLAASPSLVLTEADSSARLVGAPCALRLGPVASRPKSDGTLPSLPCAAVCPLLWSVENPGVTRSLALPRSSRPCCAGAVSASDPLFLGMTDVRMRPHRVRTPCIPVLTLELSRSCFVQWDRAADCSPHDGARCPENEVISTLAGGGGRSSPV